MVQTSWGDRRPAFPLAPRAPSRSDVQDRIAGLLDGRYSRDEVDRWAAQWVAAEGDPGVTDEAVWKALTRLHGVDMRHGRGADFLVSHDELREWLDELRS
jgi:hypothetical protein